MGDGLDGQHVKSPSKSPEQLSGINHCHWAIVNCPLLAEGCAQDNTTRKEVGGSCAGALANGNGAWKFPRSGEAQKDGIALAQIGRHDTTFWLAPIRQRYMPSRSRSSISIEHHHSKLHPSSISNSINLINKAKPLPWDPPSTAAPPTQGVGMPNLLPGGCNIHQAGTLQPPSLLRLFHCCVDESSSHSLPRTVRLCWLQLTHHTPHTTKTASFLG
ncbi:hypothetical protein F5144DRAFT_378795 [Chaetomium tenue]|uniref:Uncharacterized protein n=1 Tax=Chaetomium tenue TaxID=1854479 RepID=A0ACB7NYC2_9PEZI|nr:hypothetical protein F5144DRAFT_378795 [Chaetomium globosum]